MVGRPRDHCKNDWWIGSTGSLSNPRAGHHTVRHGIITEEHNSRSELLARHHRTKLVKPIRTFCTSQVS